MQKQQQGPNENGQKPWVLFMDLDGTMWDNLDITSVQPPYFCNGDGTISNTEGVVIRLNEGAVEFVRWARMHGAITSTLSWNKPLNAIEAMKKFKIDTLFDFNEIEFTPRKDMLMLDLLNRLRKQGTYVEPDRIVYVDDRDIHIDDIYRNVGQIIFIQIWKKFTNFGEAKNFLRSKLGLE